MSKFSFGAALSTPATATAATNTAHAKSEHKLTKGDTLNTKNSLTNEEQPPGTPPPVASIYTVSLV